MWSFIGVKCLIRGMYTEISNLQKPENIKTRNKILGYLSFRDF